MSHPILDARWGQVEWEYNSFYQKIVSKFYLKPEVPEDVKGHWNVIKSLVELSYYQIEFIDTAVQKALLSLEMAMKFRHKEITGSDKFKNKTMKPLLYWFFSRNYFEADHKEFIDRIDWMRNYYSHPITHSFGGGFVQHNIFTPLYMINDLYEDVELRKKRNKIYKDLECFFNVIKQFGGKIYWDDGKTETIYFIYSEFINNKSIPTEYSISYRPLFEIPRDYKAGDYCSLQPVVHLSFYSNEINENILKGKLTDNDKQFTITNLLSEPEKSMFALWRDEYIKFSLATGHLHAISSPIHSIGYQQLEYFYRQ